GVEGISASTNGTGVLGHTTSSTGVTQGVWGVSDSVNGTAVYGLATTTSGNTTAVHARNYSTTGKAIFAYATAPTGLSYGVYSKDDSTDGYAGYFRGNGPDSLYVENFGAGRAVQAVADTDTAIWGVTTSGIAGVDGWNAGASGRGVSGFASANAG